MDVEAYGRFMRDPKSIKTLSDSFYFFTTQNLQDTDAEVCCTVQYWYIFQQRDIVFLLIPLMQGSSVRTTLKIHFLTFFIK